MLAYIYCWLSCTITMDQLTKRAHKLYEYNLHNTRVAHSSFTRARRSSTGEIRLEVQDHNFGLACRFSLEWSRINHGTRLHTPTAWFLTMKSTCKCWHMQSECWPSLARILHLHAGLMEWQRPGAGKLGRQSTTVQTWHCVFKWLHSHRPRDRPTTYETSAAVFQLAGIHN